jgi:hypothetical protein
LGLGIIEDLFYFVPRAQISDAEACGDPVRRATRTRSYEAATAGARRDPGNRAIVTLADPKQLNRDLGVRRVTFGPGLQRVALDARQRFAKRQDVGSDRVLFE